jgi:dTDP-4-dehydrorhamnose reductase
MNTEEITLDFDLTPGAEKRIFILGINNGIGQAILKKLYKNKRLKICAFYTEQKEKNFIKDDNIIYKDFKVFSETINYAFSTKSIDFIINCLDIPEENPIKYTNKMLYISVMQYYLLGIQQLLIGAILQNKSNAKIINYTNLEVFSRTQVYKEYNEIDVHDAINEYGKFKSLSEINYENLYNLRCDLIGSNLFNNTLIKDFLNKEDNTKFEYENKIWNGITTLQFAKIVENIILNNLKPSYIQHVFSNKISTYKLLTCLNKVYDKKLQIDESINQESGHILNTVNLNFHEQLHGGEIPPIEIMLKEMKEFDAIS